MSAINPCSVIICTNLVGPSGGKGYCSAHLKRIRVHGHPQANKPIGTKSPRPATCTMPGCDKPCRARGLCSTHHQRWRVRGDPNITLSSWDTRPKKDPLDYIEITDNHWYWTGYRDKKDYGWFRGRPAHVIIYELLVEPIPPGLQIDHLCRVHPCVHPDHLEPVTQQENMRRGLCISTLNAAKTHCPKNHKYTPENTYFNNGGRICKTCWGGKTRA